MSANTKPLKENTVARESINIFNVFINSPDWLLELIIRYILKNETVYLENKDNILIEKFNFLCEDQTFCFTSFLSIKNLLRVFAIYSKNDYI